MPLKTARSLEPNLVFCGVSSCFQVCLHLAIEEKFRVNKISSDSESNSFANLSRISDEDIMEEDQEDVEESLTHKLTSRIDVT